MESATTSVFLLDPDPLLEIAHRRSSEYQSATPFPHTVIDDFLPQRVIDACIAEYPEPDDDWLYHADEGNSHKFATNDESKMGPTIRQVISQLNGGAMIRFLEELTGITGLVPDPFLAGGGLHLLGPGGFLDVHADFNVHEHLRLDRRINLLLYLNPDWQEDWGGNLELWDPGMTSCQRRIVPVANRCVIFNTTDASLHGNPQPVSCPEGMARRSLAFYYYTAGRPEEERSEPHTTIYPGRAEREAAPPPVRARLVERLRAVAFRTLPPVLVDAIRKVKSRLR